MKLSPDFTLDEFTRTTTGLENEPSLLELGSLRALCSAILQPLREKLGAPLVVSSGFRSAAVNEASSGSVHSQHLKGEAVDFVAPDRPLAWATLLQMAADGWPIDQCIAYESTRHIHVSHTHRRIARRQFLVRTRDGAYRSWDSYAKGVVDPTIGGGQL